MHWDGPLAFCCLSWSSPARTGQLWCQLMCFWGSSKASAGPARSSCLLITQLAEMLDSAWELVSVPQLTLDQWQHGHPKNSCVLLGPTFCTITASTVPSYMLFVAGYASSMSCKAMVTLWYSRLNTLPLLLVQTYHMLVMPLYMCDSVCHPPNCRPAACSIKSSVVVPCLHRTWMHMGMCVVCNVGH